MAHQQNESETVVIAAEIKKVREKVYFYEFVRPLHQRQMINH
jgi:hypothetical protein